MDRRTSRAIALVGLVVIVAIVVVAALLPH
jgi:hypothetical protein